MGGGGEDHPVLLKESDSLPDLGFPYPELVCIEGPAEEGHELGIAGNEPGGDRGDDMYPQDGGNPELRFDPLRLPVNYIPEYPGDILGFPGDEYRFTEGIVSRPPSPSGHLLELEIGNWLVPGISPSEAGEIANDHPACREIDPGCKGWGSHKSLDVTKLEGLFHDLPLSVSQAGMMESAPPFHTS